MKGVSGKIMVMLVTIILAMIALVVVYQLYRGVFFGRMADAFTSVANRFSKMICENIPILKYLC